MSVFRILIIAACCFNLCGCRSGLEEQGVKQDQVLARINDYRMSAADFKDGVAFILATKFLSVEPNEAKEELMEELITRNLLIQEAQRLNLDKQKMFMKEIERYWEQSLLKLLLQRKSEQILETMDIDDSEIIDEYMRMQRRILAQVIILNSQEAAQDLSKVGADEFTQVQENLREKIISAEAPHWWVLGDLPRYLEEPLFSLKAGENSVVASGNNWALIRVLDEQAIKIEPYKNLAAEIKNNIQRRKKEQALEQWIKDLRDKALIEVDKQLLHKITLQ